LVESVTDYAIVMLDPQGRVISWNAGAERIMGYRAEEILGVHFGRFYTAADVSAKYPDRQLTLARTHQRHEEERLHVRKDGSTYCASVVITAIWGKHQRLRGFAKVTRDITERLAAEQRRLIAQGLEVADTQRKRIAERLHDDPIQTLLSAQQDLNEVRRKVAAATGPEVQSVERAAKLLTLSLRQLRQMASDLHPAAPFGQRFGVGARLIGMEAAQRGNFCCRVDVHPSLAHVERHDALAIIRELLVNVAKHAQAKNVSVHVEPTTADGIRIVVTDDGIGVSRLQIRKAVLEGHIGLSLAAARLEEQGGRLSVNGQPGRGTAVTVVMPGPHDRGRAPASGPDGAR
jgi:PAS domain S-box-containing protein